MSLGLKNKICGLYAIIDRQEVEQFLRGGCRLIQLRMKNAKPKDVEDVARDIMSFKKQYDFTFIVNDHPEVAVTVGADGVHVGQDDCSVAEIRRRFGEKLIIGYSASRSPETAQQAVSDGATYIAFGAIFPTTAKGPDHPIHGVGRLREMVTLLRVPVVAIGGINRTNVQDVLKAGASAVAMISTLTQAPDIEAEVRWFVDALKQRGQRFE